MESSSTSSSPTASRQVFYVPTVWPHERQKAYKKIVQMDREGIALDSTDIWTKGLIQRYEERPAELETLCLAHFLAWYTPMNVKRRRGPEEDSDSEDDEPETNINTKYRRQMLCFLQVAMAAAYRS